MLLNEFDTDNICSLTKLWASSESSKFMYAHVLYKLEPYFYFEIATLTVKLTDLNPTTNYIQLKSNIHLKPP